MIPPHPQPAPTSALPSRLLKPDEAAALLKVRTSTLAGWRSAGIGPAFTKVGHSVRYFEADLAVFVASGRCAPASAGA